MTRRTDTIAPDYFDDLYKADADPWRFRSSAYERDKYAATLAGLGRARYGDALEVGCSIGVFTATLAPRCDRLLAIDGSGVALATARQACAEFHQVVFEQRMVPDAFPPGRFDLIVLSEVLYYLTPTDLDRVAEQCRAAVNPGGEVILCHWLGETDYPLTGTQAAGLFTGAMTQKEWTHAILHDRTYRLDHLSRR